MAGQFDPNQLKNLYKPAGSSSGEENGQVTIIGESELFHGAPLLSLKTASRIVDMIFFSSPEPSVGKIAEALKSKLYSFIWVPWSEVEHYIGKSDAVLIGPGFMSYRSEKDRNMVEETKKITKDLLTKFPNKKWVIDAGSLQVMEAGWIPQGAILTPNRKEFKILFGDLDPQEAARKYKCIIVLKGPTTLVVTPRESVDVKGGNAGMTKGGTGDVQAGLTAALLAKNEPFLAATSAAFIVKAAADRLYNKVGVNYNADDLAEEVAKSLHEEIF